MLRSHAALSDCHGKSVKGTEQGNVSYHVIEDCAVTPLPEGLELNIPSD